uniref:UGT91G16 n=1 Tax=Avena strigosa TaxID=38783 RepID=A0A6B9QPZ5_9POAL|nr:UGT91G16 [Avena strigosa]
MAASASRPLHLVICPWLAFGHLLPCLELAHRLASRGHRVSFVSTPRNISRLPPLPPAVAPLVNFVALPLAQVPGLPDGAEATSDVGDDKAELLRLASDGLAEPFSEFLRAAKKPDWLIVDIVNNWAAAAAAEHKVPCVALLQCAARMFTPLAGPMSHNDDWMKTYTVESPASGVSIAERCAITLKACKLAALRSCLEWEPDAVPLVKTHPQSGTPVVTLGLLPPPPPSADTRGKDDDDDATVRWLDAQPAKSVVYIALGSEVPLREEQVHEMALGLDLSGTRFLWALRRPRDAAPDADADDVLPPGFEERTRGRGLVVFGWVPQVSILAHGAVAAFLTHCGWSSTIEGLRFGRPLVMLPIATGDQWPNARLMEERGVGLRVPRDGNDGSFHREGLAATVRAVTADQGGTFAANAGKLQLVVADRECHERCIDGFIQQLTSYMD